tara:strand:+ start:260 stop:472 length:213 start_codon:yes stop_codon:yes gene_type:complete
MGGQRRKKKGKKAIQFYQRVNGLVAPYQVLVSAEGLHAAINAKVHLREDLPKVCDMLPRTKDEIGCLKDR